MAYALPTMREVRAMPRMGISAASTFSGCGGSCLGLHMAGFDVLWANDVDPSVRASYAANHPDTILDGRSIRDISPKDVLRTIGLGEGELDYLDGSPPCNPFSTAGKRDALWEKGRGVESEGDEGLFAEFARLLRGLAPKVFAAENVSGLVKGTAKGYFKMILAMLRGCGYDVEARLLDASMLGVPQARERVIFVGVRRDVGLPPAFPAPHGPAITVAEALRGWADPDPESPPQSAKMVMLWRIAGQGASFSDAAEHLVGKGSYFNSRRLAWDRPCPTITAKMLLWHPVEPRLQSAGECRRLSSFPDDYFLAGSYYQRTKRVGMAVPPLMAMAVAVAIRDRILLPRSRGSA